MPSKRCTPPTWQRPDPLPGPIETKRLVLRWFRDGDAAALQEAIAPHREAYLPWLPWAARDHATVAASRKTIRRFKADRVKEGDPDFTIGIFDRATGALLGGTGLHRIEAMIGAAEIGYWTHAEQRGRGICTEATAALVSAAFGPWGFRRVRILCASANAASQRIPAKLGIPLEGREREAHWLDGHGLDDKLCFGVLASEWDAAAGRVRQVS